MKPILPSIFRAYDIRGVVDEDFDPDWVEVLGQACGTYFLRKGFSQAVVGHDCRNSSPEYQARLTAGLLSTGVDVVFLNMVPTPVFYFAIKHLGRHAGVMVTASHNPPEFNGFKVWCGSTTIHTDEIRAIYDIMASGNFETGQGLASEHDIVPSYLDAACQGITLARPVKVVVDGGNGAGGLICAEALTRAGAEVVPLYCEPDGNFPNHHPDPVVAEYVADLRAAVVPEKADLGVGLDGDGDRLGVVDETGTLMYGDQLLAIYARDLLATRPGETVIGEVKCSHLMYADIKAHGGKPVMGATGHSLIKSEMQRTKAVLAGEMSGHMFFADRWFGFDDATYAALRIVEIVSKSPIPVSRMLADWPKTMNTPEIRMDCPEKIKFQVVKKAQEHFGALYDIIDVDGVRIAFPDGWGLMRASNTQPALVLRFEAESASRLAEIRELIEAPVRKWITELS